MQLYSASPGARIRQTLGDATAAAVVVASILVGIAVWAAIAAFADFGRRVAEAGEGLRSSMADASEALGSVPLVGDAAAAPFDRASGVGADLIATGQQQEGLVLTAAVIAGVLVALVPTVIVIRLWLPRRVAFAKRAALASRLSASAAGIDLLALRALSTARPDALLEVSDDPVGSWRSGDRSAIIRLAELEIAASGARTARVA